MAAIGIKISESLLEKARAVVLPHAGQATLFKATGISKPTIRTLIASGKALPATIEKLKAGLQKLEEAEIEDLKNPA